MKSSWWKRCRRHIPKQHTDRKARQEKKKGERNELMCCVYFVRLCSVRSLAVWLADWHGTLRVRLEPHTFYIILIFHPKFARNHSLTTIWFNSNSWKFHKCNKFTDFQFNTTLLLFTVGTFRPKTLTIFPVGRFAVWTNFCLDFCLFFFLIFIFFRFSSVSFSFLRRPNKKQQLELVRGDDFTRHYRRTNGIQHIWRVACRARKPRLLFAFFSFFDFVSVSGEYCCFCCLNVKLGVWYVSHSTEPILVRSFGVCAVEWIRFLRFLNTFWEFRANSLRTAFFKALHSPRDE